MKELGYLSNGEVILVGASKLIGAAVGTTSKAVNDLLDSAKGKVLVIDEAYVLGRTNSIYGREALDTLVERVQGGASEDFAVILCGYQDEMTTMLRDGNPGLKRRFRDEDSFYFADYTDQQLTDIMLSKAKEKGLYLSRELAVASVKNVLAKQRAKPHFGNVGAVRNLLESASEKMFSRKDRRKQDGKWLLISDDLFEAPVPDAALKALDSLVNADYIIEYVKSMQKQIEAYDKKKSDTKKLLKNFIFAGPPGKFQNYVCSSNGLTMSKFIILSIHQSILHCFPSNSLDSPYLLISLWPFKMIEIVNLIKKIVS